MDDQSFYTNLNIAFWANLILSNVTANEMLTWFHLVCAIVILIPIIMISVLKD